MGFSNRQTNVFEPDRLEKEGGVNFTATPEW